MTQNCRYVLGLGSNIGDRLSQLQGAIDCLTDAGVRVEEASSIYETEPVGEIVDQREFFNACLVIDTQLEPIALLDLAKAIELAMGRLPGPRHAPRPVDIDLLVKLDGEQTEAFDHPRLKLPHADLLHRRFVLEPLAELVPQTILPDGRTVVAALAELEDSAKVQVTTAKLSI